MQMPNVLTKTDPQLLLRSTKEFRNHEIKNFLQRAYQLGTFTWSKTDTVDTILATYRFPDILLGKPALAAKTRNFFGLRSGIELMVLVNSQPFQAGNLLVTAFPNAKYNPSKRAMYAKSIPLRTGLPRLNLDLKDDAQVKLTMPYDSPFVYFNLLFGVGTIADIDISVYSALTDVAAAGVVNCEVFARFIDIDLEFPTGEVPVPFNSAPTLTSLYENFQLKPNLTTLNSILNEGQSLVDKFKNGQYKFQANDADVSTTNMKLRALPNMAVTDSQHNSHVMSFYSNNALNKSNMGRASMNEMQVQSALRIFNIHDRFFINTNTSGNVWYKSVEPKIPYKVNTDGSLQVDYLYYHTLPFALWGGSIEYKFIVVNTTFHSLRFRIFYSPASINVDSVDRNAVYSDLVDVEGGAKKEITFQVPYVYPYPKLNVHKGETSLGIIALDIVNKMVAPDSVDPQIEVIVERRAGTNFVMDLPVPLTAFPFDPTPRTEPVLKSRLDSATPIKESVGNAIKKFSAVGALSNSDPQFLARMTRLTPALKQEIGKNSFRFNQNYVSMLNDLAQYEEVGTNFLGLSKEQLETRLKNIFTLRNPTQNFLQHDELRKKRDLTQDGDVESNPGPIFSQQFVTNNSGGSSSFVIPTGLLEGSLTIFTTGGATGVVTTPWGQLQYFSNASSGDSDYTVVIRENSTSSVWPFSFTSDRNGARLGLTLSVQQVNVPGQPIDVNIASPSPLPVSGTVTIAQPVDVNVVNTITNPIDVNVVNTNINPVDVNVVNTITNPIDVVVVNTPSDPIDVNIVSPIPLPTTGGGGTGGDVNIIGSIPLDVNVVSPIPLPTTGGGGSSDIVTTTSYQFQAFYESQDSERVDGDDLTFHRPEASRKVDELTLGEVFSSITTNISRASIFGSLDTTTKDQLVRIMPHAMGALQKDADGLIHSDGCDMLSYYAASFAFARGGVHLGIVAAPDFYYTMYLDPDAALFDVGPVAPVSQAANVTTPATQLKLNNALQQVIKPQIEGFGEITIPFYSNTYMYSISPSTLYDPDKSTSVFNLPRTQIVLNPKGNFSDFHIYRTASSDFEFSYLTGAPLLLPI